MRQSIEDAAAAFHAENPEVYELFLKFAKEALLIGHKRYSADAVMHRVRWETNASWFGDRNRDFKINNNHVSWYARKLMSEDSRFQGFFRLRGTREEIEQEAMA